jgi:hypothetical protein
MVDTNSTYCSTKTAKKSIQNTLETDSITPSKLIKNNFKINISYSLSNNHITNNLINYYDWFSLSKLINKNVLFNYFIIFLLFACTKTTNGCDIWKASDCVGSITGAEEELMKSDDYTKEQLYKYCDKGKAYVDCINSKLKCCDLKPELRGALAAYDKQLERQAWKLGPYCSGLGESNIVKYKCRTTTRATTSAATKSTKPTLAPCQIEKVVF